MYWANYMARSTLFQGLERAQPMRRQVQFRYVVLHYLDNKKPAVAQFIRPLHERGSQKSIEYQAFLSGKGISGTDTRTTLAYTSITNK